MQKSDDTLTARVAVPQSKSDPSDVKFEEIPLPPRELWGDIAAAAGEANAGLPANPPEDITDVAELEFVDASHQISVPLKYPFRLNGRVVKEVKVRRLTLGQVDAFIRRAAAASFSTFDIYAEMTGLPAPILRGLIDEDGNAVVDAAYDFLPRVLKAESASTET
ncbi:phage tail assembly protein [Agrobacterium genomosp. 2]|uniref:Tail assembly chaperone E/41/14-like protein n=1 Tax=Agrobacterium genomosp. 2 str. CFBP 5494 TaxID=1183436 RepID=A0A9W5F1L2_9HYPH|nr:phage tail assembly protein [Agrobacterium genomosp. 2]CUW88240.1 conserved hypothetical protein [Agrobacterium genomosp. 2 str. CFBP 5494]